MTNFIAIPFALLVAATLGWAALDSGPAGSSDCLSSADVARSQADSRNGISLTCTSEIAEQNARRRAE